MIEVVAAEATVVILVSAITGIVLVLTTAAVIWMFFFVFGDYEGSVRDVQRFVELTEQARSLVPAGLPLLDQEKAAATTEAIGRFAKQKEQARRALWESRNGREQTAAALRAAAFGRPEADRRVELTGAPRVA
jgi:hypothetical protein